MGRFLASIVQTKRLFGLKAAAKRTVSRTAQKLLRIEISEMLWLDRADLRLASEANPHFEFRFLSANEIATLARDPSNDLDLSFADRADSGFDFCFAAVTQSGEFASYSWYAIDSIEAEHHAGVAMSLPPRTAYMYKAFTPPKFRGQRLYGATVDLAFRKLATRGITQLVTTVEWTNFASLRSCERMGFRRLGRLVTFGQSHDRPAITPKAARKLGVRFGDDTDVLPRSHLQPQSSIAPEENSFHIAAQHVVAQR